MTQGNPTKRTFTEEHKRKISLALKGKKRPPEVVEKYASKLRGRTASPETRLKQSKAGKGRKFTEEHKHKLSEAQRGRQSPMKGKTFTKEHKERIGLAQKGEKGNNWKGGIKVLHLQEWRKIQHQKRRALKKLSKGTISVKEWIALKEAYNYTCPSCRKKEPEIELTMDHIIPISRDGKHCIANIQPLCRECNGKKHAKTILFSRKIINQTQLIFQ